MPHQHKPPFFNTTCIALMLCSMLPSTVFSQNLVPNPGFETYIKCPSKFAQIDLATGWTSYFNTPDYFNSCDSGDVSTPANLRGSQIPYEGNAYASITAYTNTGVFDNNNEIMGIQLSQALEVGKTYYVSFQASLADKYGIAVKDLGLKFLPVPFSQTNPIILPTTPDIVASDYVDDSKGWETITGTYTATLPLQYIAIGNFNINPLTTRKITDPNKAPGAHYYIDYVYVGLTPPPPPPPPAPLVADFTFSISSICVNDCVSFKDSIVSGFPTKWEWKFPGAKPSVSSSAKPGNICYSDTGTYDVMLIVSNDAQKDTIVKKSIVRVNKIPLFELGKDTSFNRHDKVLLNAMSPSSATNSYLWSNGSTEPSISVSEEGVVWAEVSNECGTFRDSIFLEYSDCLFLVPDAFSPSNDDINSTFTPTVSCEIKAYHLQIFDRWGRFIFDSTDITKGWDGTYNGLNLPTGSYIYLMSYTGIDNGKEVIKSLKGIVNLIR